MNQSGLLQWRDTPNGYGPIAQVIADFALDTIWRVGTDGGYQEKRIAAAVLTVDNSANDASCTVTINGIATLCSANVRTNFPVPRGISFFDITAPSGSTTLNFYADRRDVPPDLPNFAAIIANTVAASRLNHGNCILTLAGAALLLSPRDGNALMIGGTTQQIPSGGIALAATGIASTLLYIYAAMIGGVMTLEASATGHTTDVTSGVEVKLGDPTRTLVGMTFTDAGGLWQNQLTNRAVRSWFNDLGIRARGDMLVDSGTLSAVDVELNVAMRASFLSWANEIFYASCTGKVTAGIGLYPRTSIIFDATAGTGPGLWTRTLLNAAGVLNGITIAGARQFNVDGYHFASLMGRSDGANVVTWDGATADERCTLFIETSGKK